MAIPGKKYTLLKNEKALASADHFEIMPSGDMILNWLAPTDDPERFDVVNVQIHAAGTWDTLITEDATP